MARPQVFAAIVSASIANSLNPSTLMADPAQTPAGGGIAEAINRAFGAMLAHALDPLMYLLLALVLAAPAVASMLLLWAGARWPRLERSMWMSALAGAVLTFLSGWVVGALVVGAGEVSDVVQRNYQAEPYAAGVLVLIAAWLQIRARTTFSWPRAAGLVAAVMTPIALLFIQSLAYR